MAVEIPGFKLGTLLAAADVADSQHRFAALDGGVVLADAGLFSVGVIENIALTEGNPVEITVSGVAKVVCGGSGSGTVTAEALVASDANGAAVDATSTDYALGVALEGGDEDQIISVLLISPHVVA